MSSLVGLLLIGMIVFVVHLERRLARLERRIAEGAELPIAAPADRHGPEAVAVAEHSLTAHAAALTQSEIFDAERRPSGAVEDGPAALGSIENWHDEQSRRGPSFAFGLEDLFGRRLPIWAGGIALAIAGFLIVKLSIEAGLLSPPVRVIAGAIFGIVLIGSAEAALRYHDRVGDVRVRQALSGAGLASLYASVLVAANLYHLVPALPAMLAITVITGAAMLLSIRFGAPSALLGLAGGLAAPALVGSTEPNVPLLTLYLALAVGGLAALSRNQRWAWLGISALVGGFGWGVALLLGGALDVPATISLGLYMLLLGVGLPALGLAEGHGSRLQLVAGIIAAAQIAALVATGGFALLNWGLFAVIAAAMVWLAARQPTLAPLPAIGLVIALLLAGAWPAPDQWELALVLTGFALIHGVMPLRRLWSENGTLLDAAQIAVIALGSWPLAMYHFHTEVGSNDAPLGFLALGLSLLATVTASLGWRSPQRRSDARFAIVAIAAALLLAGASALLLPAWLIGVATAAIGLGVLHLGQAADDRHFEPVAWMFAAAGLVAFLWPDSFVGNSRAIDSLRWALMAGAAAMFAWRGSFVWARAMAQFLAPVLLYFALDPWVAEHFEPLIPTAMIVAIAWAATKLQGERLVPAMVSAAMISLIWAVDQLAGWSQAAITSLLGEPMLLESVPAAKAALTQLFLPGAAIAIAAWLANDRLNRRERVAGFAVAAALGGVGLHSLYKQVFALTSAEQFIALGLAERTLWETVLAGGAALAWRFGQLRLALALFGAALLHFALYTLLLHNPLWAAQAVGPLPLFNLLLPAYALPLVLLALCRRSIEPLEPILLRTIAIAQILLIGLLAFSSLRQLFHGTLLIEPGLSQFEDICRSMVAIALAVAFLLWGIARQDRDWRIASLVLMLGAVGKVFLSDASGLEGLTRVASFVVLGLSLIGIGWLYARYLPGDAAQVAKLGSSR